MRFKIRPGFHIFESPDAAASFEASGTRSGVKPIPGGRVVNLTPEQASLLLCRGRLGALEPIDDEARKFYGNTEPLTPDTETNPTLYAIRPEPEPVRFAMGVAR